MDIRQKGEHETAISIDRLFDAPREVVFEAWTRSEHLRHWFAPHALTTPVAYADARPGGRWKAVMRGADGATYVAAGVYRIVDAPEHLAFTHAWLDGAGQPGPQTLVDVRLSVEGQRTRMHFHQAPFDTMASLHSHRDGWLQCLDRLADYVGEWTDASPD